MAVSIVLSQAAAVNFQVAADRLAFHNDGGEITEYPGFGWDADRYEPDPFAEAQEAGYARGYALDYAAQAPSEFDSLTRICWTLGKVQGVTDRQDDDRERAKYEAELDEELARRAEIHPDEAVRAVGCVSARAIGGVR